MNAECGKHFLLFWRAFDLGRLTRSAAFRCPAAAGPIAPAEFLWPERVIFPRPILRETVAIKLLYRQVPAFERLEARAPQTPGQIPAYLFIFRKLDGIHAVMTQRNRVFGSLQ